MDFGEIFSKLSLSDLNKVKSILDKQIKATKLIHKRDSKNKDIKDFVSLHEHFLDKDDVLFANIQADIESLDIKRPRSGTSTLWLSPDDQAYSWTSKDGTEFTNKPVSFNKAPAINELLTNIIKKLGLDLNSCLVTFFKNGTSSIKFHQDNEPEMDPSAPICVFTMGEGRQVDFLSQYQAGSETPLLSLIYTKRG